MLGILINAYACSPNMGSEPGMAWNWCVNLAKYCELHIITEGEFRDKIEAVVPTLEYGQNLHFYYNPVSEKIRRMCWNQGDWRFYIYYKRWQKKTAAIARDICKREKIDILHQLNMIGFREPGYLWQVSQETDIPFVWGPVDAKESFPMAYAVDAPLKMRFAFWLKNTVTKWQLQHSRRVGDAVKCATMVMSASSNSVNSFRKYFNIDSPLFNETGTSPIRMEKHPKEKNSFDILWVGKADFRKQLPLAIKAVSNVIKNDMQLHIVGCSDKATVLKEIEMQGILNQCVLHGCVSHDEVLKLMRTADVLLFTSVAEGTPHVVLEAVSCGVPVVCFNTCGQGDCVNEDIGSKIPLTNPNQSVKDFAERLEFLYNHRDVLQQMSDNCHQRAEELSWENIAKKIVRMYGDVIQKKDDAQTV